MFKKSFALLKPSGVIVAFSLLPKASNQKREKSIGFTLIELMIVIAIIAILASILVPNFSKSKGKAQLEACKSNLRNISMAMEMYASDYSGHHSPSLTSTPQQWNDCAYLVPAYLKAAPQCPLYGYYIICANHPGFRSAPAGGDALVGKTDPGIVPDTVNYGAAGRRAVPAGMIGGDIVIISGRAVGQDFDIIGNQVGTPGVISKGGSGAGGRMAVIIASI